jgi:hypothetical protein
MKKDAPLQDSSEGPILFFHKKYTYLRNEPEKVKNSSLSQKN